MDTHVPSRPSLWVPRLLLLLASAQMAHGWTHCKVLSCPLNYRLSWSIDTANSALLAELSAPASGWLGLGLSTDTSMISRTATTGQGSDMWVGSAGMGSSPDTGSIRDYHASSYATPSLDTSQDPPSSPPLGLGG